MVIYDNKKEGQGFHTLSLLFCQNYILKYFYFFCKKCLTYHVFRGII